MDCDFIDITDLAGRPVIVNVCNVETLRSGAADYGIECMIVLNSGERIAMGKPCPEILAALKISE